MTYLEKKGKPWHKNIHCKYFFLRFYFPFHGFLGSLPVLGIFFIKSKSAQAIPLKSPVSALGIFHGAEQAKARLLTICSNFFIPKPYTVQSFPADTGQNLHLIPLY